MDADDDMTEEQRNRAEANRLTALARRKAAAATGTVHDPWGLFKCRKISRKLPAFPEPQTPLYDSFPKPETPLAQKFRAWLEICSPDSFSVTPVAAQGFVYPGENECLAKLRDCLSDVLASHYTQNHGGEMACVYKLRDYDKVVRSLKKSKGIEVEEIPWGTFNVVEKLSHSYIEGRWIPCRPEHLPSDKVDELIENLPRSLVDVLMPFQLDGVKFGLQRGGRCLIADEMGLGKTLQAIAIASCFMNEGSMLVVCPAILRFSWAEELERWLPLCLPADIHLVFNHRDNPANLMKCPRIVITSYTMLHHLRKSMLELEWAILIVDESHHVRCTKKMTESEEIKVVLDLASKVKRIILLSGTPSLSRPYDIFHQINMLWPGLLGKNKYEFAKTYCDVKFARASREKIFQDFSKGIRLEELNVLLKQTVMIRRLKEHVLVQLPPKHRKIITLPVKRSDVVSAMAAIGTLNSFALCQHINKEKGSVGSGHCVACAQKISEALGFAKLSGFCEWLSFHPVSAEWDANLDINRPQKMIIFAHHHNVLNGVQEILCKKGIGFVRIDGKTPERDRHSAIVSFQSSIEVKIAIIGVTAACQGLNLTIAQHVVFLELPQMPSILSQGEDRAHRLGQTSSVNIYIFCAKGSLDESRWQNLNESLRRVSSTTNGKYDAIQEIEVEDVSYFETSDAFDAGHEQGLENSAFSELYSEQMNLLNNGLDQDKHFVQAYDKTLEKNEKTGTASDLEMEKDFFSNRDMGGNLPEEIGSPGKIFSCNLNKDSKQQGQFKMEGSIFLKGTEAENGGPFQEIEADESYSNQVNSLRFEVSQHTGRIHLYSCIPGTDSRPRPLFQNFQPEEFDSLSATAAVNRKTNFHFIKESPSYRHAVLAFINDWNNLKPIERKRLLGKPLQLPLAVELCYLEESINHNKKGLLNGGSKRRTTPLCEVSCPLPSNAVWRKVHLCGGYKRKENEYTQGWTLTDEPLCKLCQKLCTSNNAKTPEFFEDLFCNLSCYEEYRLRTSNKFLRQELFEIEHGVCTICQLDCHKLVQYIKPLSLGSRQEYIQKIAPNIAKQKKLLDKLVNCPIEGNAWHADHIVPVYRGGGECRLENLRTLCVACHSDVTATQCAERRAIKSQAKKQLEVIISDMRSGQTKIKGETDANLKDKEHLSLKENKVECELLINIPGSAYTERKCTGSKSEDLDKQC
ncbi:uncharacterized protein LOC131146912 isoform X2 [Malania oleifera]|uniref:uncharacterized protein LOC131146912 isoform X2 n=1 Tax=Malania oleifera TaxID=397392 RepID=UPI0025AEC38E|nr:uncharacterized protein LOC131146912 isoform X2 [Malania oleifera]